MALNVRKQRLRVVMSATEAVDGTPRSRAGPRAPDRASRNAAELAWDRYAPLVHGIVSRALGPDAEVEDVTQEIFYRLFSRIGTLRKPEALRSFVISFAVRIVKWELRRRRARRWLTLSETGEVPEDQMLVMNAESRYALRRLYGLLDKLNTRERLVLVLRHIEGMTLEEIAEAMELSLATVKRVLRRAPTVFRSWWTPDGQAVGPTARSARPELRREPPT